MKIIKILCIGFIFLIELKIAKRVVTMFGVPAVLVGGMYLYWLFCAISSFHSPYIDLGVLLGFVCIVVVLYVTGFFSSRR